MDEVKQRTLNAPATQRKLVLAVDDAPESRFLLGRLAERAGYALVTAQSGAECLSLILRFVPRLILLDVEMPGMSGFDACRRIRANQDFAHVPIAFLTARKAVEDVTAGLDAGGNDFILKPFDGARLIERMHHWTARRV